MQQAMDLSDKLTGLLMEIGFTEDGEDVNPKGRIIEEINYSPPKISNKKSQSLLFAIFL